MTDASSSEPRPPKPRAPSGAPRKDALRDAATVVAVRRDGSEPRILMGQRGAKAAFMPSKFVFPGGAVDADDAAVPADPGLTPETAKRLDQRLRDGAPERLGHALAMAAIRELWEESGLALATRSREAAPDFLPEDWRAFFAAGYRPAAERLSLIFRAITPPGRPRRFDARFFLVDAEALLDDPDDFSRASDELSHLSWVSLPEARRLDLPFITGIVLAELEARLADPGAFRPAPFFHHDGGRSFIDGL